MDTEPVHAVEATRRRWRPRSRCRGNGWRSPRSSTRPRRFLGYVRAERVDGAVQAGQPVLPVGELTDDEDASLPPDAPLGALLGASALAGMGAIAVVEPGGRLAGVVTMARVRQAIAAVASQRPL